MSNAQTIFNFFLGKGLTPAQAAGIMGNLEVESDFNTEAYNGNEGAHGLVQWEGGRWPALQQFASQMGGNPLDINVQLNFIWHELTTSYSGVLQQIKSMSDPQSIAQVIQSQYEGSTPDSLPQREANAANIYKTYMSGGTNALANIGPAASSGGGTGGGVTTAGAPSLTDADYRDALGNLAGLLQTVPELKDILQQAISGGWAVTKFQQAVENSNWYRQHNDSAKQLVALQASDPAEYATRVSNAQNQVSNLAKQLGVNLNQSQVAALAQQFMVQGWDNQELVNKVGGSFNVHTPAGQLSGQAAQLYQQITQAYNQQGIPISDLGARMRVAAILSGQTTIDTYKQAALENAKSMFPSLAAQIDAGMTVEQIADPYRQAMANTLELDPNSIALSDPTLMKALQGTTTTTAGKTTATSTTLYDFQRQLRNDPRWAQTQNAKDTISTALVHIGRDFGFGGF